MDTEYTATRRPQQQLPLTVRLCMLPLLAAAALESVRYLLAQPGPTPGAGLLRSLLGPTLARYEVARTWVVTHPVLTATVTAAAVVLLIVAYRWWLLFWHNEIVARLS